jgi:hypothetical protein
MGAQMGAQTAIFCVSALKTAILKNSIVRYANLPRAIIVIAPQ